MTLPNWLKRKARPPALFKQNINAAKFKDNTARVGYMETVFHNTIFQHACAVAMSLAPPHRDYDNKDNAMFDIGVIRGMRKFYEALEYLATHEQKHEPPEMDWGVSEIGEETKS